MKNSTALNWETENEYFSEGYEYICGVDEAGRGPLCGPIVAAACILPRGLIIDGLNDSKKLSPKKRDQLYEIITASADAWSVASASRDEIDELNILNADMLAMRRAIEGLTIQPSLALIDGNISRNIPCPSVTLIGGDGISPSIAAASVIAKVTRDRICVELDALYPEYGIAKHKGYPTKAHFTALYKFGPSPCHRKTFLKFLHKDGN